MTTIKLVTLALIFFSAGARAEIRACKAASECGPGEVCISTGTQFNICGKTLGAPNPGGERAAVTESTVPRPSAESTSPKTAAEGQQTR
jgi:hypothetical protein